MAKVSGSYESVVRGVSEQAPQDRLSGQHGEQVNMVPDPVRGLSRRHGSITVAEALLPNTFATLLSNTATHRAFTFGVDGLSYDLLYRTGSKVVAGPQADSLFCFSRGNSTFVPVVMHDTIATQALSNGGVSAITQVGRYVLMGGNTYTTTWTSVGKFDTAVNQSRMALWIRGGAYSRTYTITLTERLTGTKHTVLYKTKSASYPTLLDTSALLTSDPDYQKLVNDMVYAYNSEVTKWIGTAAADITPENIAAKLCALYNAVGTWGVATVTGSTIVIENSLWGEVSIDDGGDNSLAEAVGNVVEAAEGLCPVHFVGKVVKVRPSKESPETAYYVEAYAKDDRTTGVTEVTWKEGAAVVNTPVRLFVIATVEEGVLYVSDDIAWLEGQIGDAIDDVPTYTPSAVGDGLSNPLPNFLGQKIDFLALFQDRLIVGTGPVLSMSRPGDYFNFFRASVLTLRDNDPVEEFSLGSEEDVIKHATLFNRDLILYGQRGQYAISGRQAVTPRTAGIVAALSKYEGSIDAAPQTSGNLAFYVKKRGPQGRRVTSLQQIQPAALSDNPDSQDVSQQLDLYLQGTATELVTATTPNTVFLRTDYTRNGLYLYNYLDKANSGERIVDAWHRWEWDPLVGHILGMATSADGDLLVYMARQDALGRAWLACERFNLSGTVSSYPYLDAQRDQSITGSLLNAPPVKLAKAFASGPNGFEGSTLVELSTQTNPEDMTGSRLGVLFDSYVEPTNPFPKDSNGRAISFGRLTLGPVVLAVADTGGVVVTSTRFGTVSTVLDFNGFSVDMASLPGTQAIVSRTLHAFIGGEVRECSFRVSSKRWLPLTITALEWAGQIFNRQRRA